MTSNLSSSGDSAPAHQRRAHRLGLVWLAVALLFVSAIGVGVGLNKTDIHLTLRTQTAVEIGGPRLEAHVDGRDAYLSGEGTEGDVAHALLLIEGIPGLRAVHNDVLIVPERFDLDFGVSEPDPSVSVVFDEGRITLRGLVPDDGSRDAIFAAASRVVGSDMVRDRVRETRSVRSVRWLADVAPAIEAIAGVSGITLAFGNSATTVSGAVATADSKERVVDALRAVGVDAAVGSLSVIEPAQPWLSMHMDSDLVIIDGAVGRAQLFEVMAAFDQAYPDANPDRDQFEFIANSADAAWPALFVGLLPSTRGLDAWRLTAEGSRLTVTGVASDAAVASRLAIVAARLSRDDSTVEVDIELSPGAFAAYLSGLVANSGLFEAGATGGDGENLQLTVEGEARLDQVVATLLTRRDLRIIVEGHVAAGGDLERERIRSDTMAAVVRSYLVRHGIDPQRVGAVGRGAHLSIASPDGEGADARVIFVVGSGGSS